MPVPLSASSAVSMTSPQSSQVSPELHVTSQSKRIKPELKRMSSSPLPHSSGRRASEPADPSARPSAPPHCCEEPGCARRFNRKYTLLEHMKTHTGEKPHVCPMRSCNKRFSTSGNLSRHKRLHGYIEPLECPVDGCLSTFPSNNKLEKHMKFHLGSAVHVCTIDHCGKTFSTTGNLNRHVKHQHPGAAASAGSPCASRASAPSPTNSEPFLAASYTSLLVDNNADVSHSPSPVQSNAGMQAFASLPPAQMGIQLSSRPYLQPQQQQDVSPVPSTMGTWNSDEMVDALTEIFDEAVAQPECPVDKQTQSQGDGNQGQVSILDDMINFHVANLS